MVQIKKILVAFDGSEHCLKALEHVRKLVKDNDAELTVIHVLKSDLHPVSVGETDEGEEYVYHPHLSTGMVTSGRMREDRKRLDLEREFANKVIEIAKSQLDDLENVHYEKQIGNPARRIIKYADDNNMDLIVVANRGLGALRNIILGSVSRKIVDDAKASVYVVK